MLSPTTSGKLSPLLFPALLLLAIALLAAACGGDDEGDGGETASPTETPTEQPTETAPAGTTAEIAMIPSIQFNKAELTIAANSEVTVTFDNQDTNISHNWAAYTDDSAAEAIAGANENICAAPCSGEVTLPPLEPGRYFFRCDVHPTQMNGTLIVQ